MYRPSPLSESRDAIDTYLETVALREQEEMVSATRNSGISVGEQDASELFEALLNPETRNVAQLIVPDVSKADNLVQILMGTLVPPRREYLLAHEEEANEDE